MKLQDHISFKQSSCFIPIVASTPLLEASDQVFFHRGHHHFLLMLDLVQFTTISDGQ
jgi:hypothetical protein